MAENQVDTYAEWIGRQTWDFFCTFTTRYTLTMPSARRMMETYGQFLATQCQAPTRLFWVAEPFDIKHGYHTHCLLRVCYEGIFPEYKHGILKNCWKKMTGGGRCDISRYNKKGGAQKYAAKYIQKKRSDFDYQLWDPEKREFTSR